MCFSINFSSSCIFLFLYSLVPILQCLCSIVPVRYDARVATVVTKRSRLSKHVSTLVVVLGLPCLALTRHVCLLGFIREPLQIFHIFFSSSSPLYSLSIYQRLLGDFVSSRGFFYSGSNISSLPICIGIYNSEGRAYRYSVISNRH